MVKANAYGIGAAPATGALEALEPWGYGVVSVAEGAALRDAGIRRPVIVFGPLADGEVDDCLRHDLRPVLGDLAALRRWLGRGSRPFHVEIDTGMHRLGFPWHDADQLAAAGGILKDATGWEGAFTHFHSSDVQPDTVREQWERLLGVVGALPRRPPMVHAANSAAAMLGPAYAGDLVRPGIYLYGGAAGAAVGRPVIRFGAPVVAARRLRVGDTVSYAATWRAERPTTVVTIAAGYADGIPRSLGARGLVEVGGELHPIVGRVTMDFTMVDVGDAAVAPGDHATIFGGARSLDEQAAAAGTISYELLTGLGARVHRRYTEER